MSSVLKVDNIEKYYGSKANLTKAIDRISFEVEKGEYIGIMGASGSVAELYINHRPCDGRKYFDQWNGYYQTEREASFKIQERGTGIYLSGL